MNYQENRPHMAKYCSVELNKRTLKFSSQSWTELSKTADIDLINLSYTDTIINRLFAYCKGGNFNIHIWAWLGYFIC